MRIALWMAVAFAATSALGQTHHLHHATQPGRAPEKTAAVLLRVKGTYLAPPRTASPIGAPTLVVTCSHGSVQKNYLDFKAVLAARSGSFPAMLEAHFDGKPTYIGAETMSADRRSVSLPGSDLQKILHAHRVVIGADEYLGTEILIQFEMPDAAAIQAACGEEKITPEILPGLLPVAPLKPILSTELRHDELLLHPRG